MNELALFTGIGGGLLSSYLLGHRTVCAVEQNPYCIEVLVQRQNERTIPIFQYGMTSVHLMGGLGMELWTWFLEDSPVRHLALLQEGELLQKRIYGDKCLESLEKSNLKSSLQKMYPEKLYWKPKKTLKRLVINADGLNFQRKTLVQTVKGKDFGYLHTPTTMANFSAPSMQKHLSCRNYVQAFGKPSPMNFEYLMGFPSGWSDLKPLEMHKFRLWLQSHGLD